MTPADINAALEQYGAHLDAEGFICRNGLRTSVRLIVKRGRLRAEGSGEVLLYSGAPVPKSVETFVEKFWYWTKHIHPTI